MKKIIAKKEYDTEKAELIRRASYGSYGSPDGYEESLYKMPDGAYFLYTAGGEKSKHKSEGIKRMSEASAEAWLSENK